MSIVSDYTTPEAKDALRRQRRIASISSVFAAILVVVLIGLVMALIFLPGSFFESPTIVTYNSASQKEEKIEQKQMPRIQRQPSAPSSSMARVIASTTPTTTAIPVPEVNVTDRSTDFGSGDDFGDGWGSGSGSGSGSGGTTFFGQTSSAERVAFVIDFSASMGGGRQALMRKELTKSLDKMAPGTKFQMIFFAGPAWVAGNKVTMNKHVSAEVKGGRGHKYEWKCGGGAHSWKPVGKRQIPEWLEATDGKLSIARKHVQETKLVWGTIWAPPLEMALSMEPYPQVIYFMTDGSAGKESMDTAETIGKKARTKGITINCIAMMEPKAHKAMEELAKRTKGQFTKVMKGGKVEKVR